MQDTYFAFCFMVRKRSQERIKRLGQLSLGEYTQQYFAIREAAKQEMEKAWFEYKQKSKALWSR